MHVREDARSRILPCSDTGWNKFVECVRGFARFDADMSKFAKKVAVEKDIPFDTRSMYGVSKPPNADYNYKCYKKFCDVSKIKRLKESEKCPEGMFLIFFKIYFILK